MTDKKEKPLSYDDKVVDNQVLKLMFNQLNNTPEWMDNAYCVESNIGIQTLIHEPHIMIEQCCQYCPVRDKCFSWGEKFKGEDVVYGYQKSDHIEKEKDTQ